MKIPKKQPPRLTGDPKSDAEAIEEYLFYLYETINHVIETISKEEE